MLAMLVMSLAVAIGLAGEGEDRVIGRSTDFHTSLIALSGSDFHGLQITVRNHRPCQVRAFFQDAPPRAAQYCSGRVTRRHMADAGLALEPGQTGASELEEALQAAIDGTRIAGKCRRVAAVPAVTNTPLPASPPRHAALP